MEQPLDGECCKAWGRSGPNQAPVTRPSPSRQSLETDVAAWRLPPTEWRCRLRAYYRIDPMMDENKSHYTPAQFGAFLKVLLLAGRQRHRGRFRSRAALIGSLPAAYAKLVPFLIEQRDLVEQSDGTILLLGWDDWQEGDFTVRERLERLRKRRLNGDSAVTGP